MVEHVRLGADPAFVLKLSTFISLNNFVSLNGTKSTKDGKRDRNATGS
jgi:hypothetical protein